MWPRTRSLLLVAALSHATAASADPQMDSAIEALKHDHSLKVRTQAALVLGQRGASEAVAPLSEALAEDDSTAVRIAAATALGRIGDPDGRAALENASQADPEAQVRTAAQRALASLGKPPPSRGLAHALALEPTQGKGEAEARAALGEALARHLVRKGFSVVPAGSEAAYRLKPSVLVLDVEGGDSQVVVAVKASVIAVARDGRMELIQSGARVKASSGPREKLIRTAIAGALEAIGKGMAEDLAAKLR